jgi:hypothetical protein
MDMDTHIASQSDQSRRQQRHIACAGEVSLSLLRYHGSETASGFSICSSLFALDGDGQGHILELLALPIALLNLLLVFFPVMQLVRPTFPAAAGATAVGRFQSLT